MEVVIAIIALAINIIATVQKSKSKKEKKADEFKARRRQDRIPAKQNDNSKILLNNNVKGSKESEKLQVEKNITSVQKKKNGLLEFLEDAIEGLDKNQSPIKEDKGEKKSRKKQKEKTSNQNIEVKVVSDNPAEIPESKNNAKSFEVAYQHNDDKTITKQKLNKFQKAIIYSEVLGKPKALK